MDLFLKCIWFIWIFDIVLGQIPPKSVANDGDFNNLREDGSYEFGYANKDQGESYHISQANRANVVRGRFGSRDPASGSIKETVYTSGPRGFRARGPNVHRKMDLDQRPRGPIGNKDDPYFDPNEDPSYSFGQKTATYEKQEEANRRGDVSGRYSFIDDIGERHNVEYIAGKDTGFHVKTPFPDSNPGSTGPLFYNGPLVRGEKKQRGHTSIQRGVDGSYRFISAGPDQRRTESSDAQGNVRGSYSFLDDKGVQRTVHYIAGPGIGYRVVKNNKDPFIPSFFPVLPDYRDPDLNKPFVTVPDNFIPDVTFPDDKDAGIDDIFGRPGGSAASGHVKPPINNNKPPTKPPSIDNGDKSDNSIFDNDDIFGPPTRKPTFSPRPTYRPTFQPTINTKPNENKGDDGGFLDSNDGDDDIFGGPSKTPNTNKPTEETSVNNNNVGTDNNVDNNNSDGDDDDDIFGSSKPTKPTFGNNNQNQGFRPTVGSRPTDSRPVFGERPGSGGKRPGTGTGSNIGGTTSSSGRPGSSNRPFPGNRPGNGFRPPFGGRPTYRPTRPTKRPTTSEPDLFGSNEEGYNYDKPSSKPSLDSGEDTSDIFGESNFGNVGSTSASKPFGPVNRPTSTSSTSDRDKNNQGSSVDEDDDDIFGSSDSGYPLKPPKTTGSTDTTSTISSGTRPGSTDYAPGGDNLRPTVDSNESTDKPDKPIGPPRPTSPSSSTPGFLDGDDDDIGGYGNGPKIPVNQNGVIGNQNSFTTEISLSAANGRDKGGTIFRNIGEELISFPPGASVRAHVQSIDLFPISTKAPTPGEAIDQELKKHGS